MEKKNQHHKNLKIVHVLIIKVHKKFFYGNEPESFATVMNKERVTSYRIL